MSEWVDKQNRFERFIQHVGVNASDFDAFFKDGFIESVETSKLTPEWKIFVKKKILIPSTQYRSLCQAASAKFPHITKLQLIVDYDEVISDSELVEMYWPNFVEWAQTEVVSINGWLAKAKIEVTSDLINLILLDTTALELAKKRDVGTLVRNFYYEYFSREFRVSLEVSASRVEEYERFQAQIVAEEMQFKQELISESTLRVAKNQLTSLPGNKWTFGYEIKDIPIPIQKIQEEEKKVIIQGSIFQLDVKELRNGSTLFQFSLTDFSESIQCKCFAKTKEDVKILNQLTLGNWVRIRGRVEYDRFMQEPDLVVIVSDINEAQASIQRHDDADEKRVEFHLHTTMSTMDAVSDITEYIQLAAKWGHKALAVTDHANVQSFPEAAKVAKKYGIKMIYGIEANVLNDGIPIVHQADDRELSDATYVIYDVETTGLSVTYNKIIELAGVKMKNGKIIAHFSEFINPHEAIPQQITQLTNITNEMVSQAPEEREVISRFVDWAGDCVFVAHNARFDSGFLDAACKRHGIMHANNPVMDSLEMARWLYPNMKNHRLNTLADKYKVSLENHHRAIDDAQALSEIVFHMLKEVSTLNMKFLSDLNCNIGRDLSNVRPFHCNIYALNAIGKKNLYKLVSISHTQYFQRVPCIPKSKLEALRDGLWIGSGCEKGEFFETVLNKSFEEAQEVARFYDFFEIQPLTFYKHLVDKGLVTDLTQIQLTIHSILEIGRNLGKPVIATGNVHYAHPHQQLFREITIHGITGFSPLKDLRKPDAHFRTTNEMLDEFSFLNRETAYDVVVRNTIALAERFESIELFPDQLYTPLIEGADVEIRNKCYETARRLYGDPIPEVVEARLEKELQPIIKYGFSANYLISERLVKKSNEDGYLVGSRGSVGSSIVATFLGISEVNPLPAHYLCRSCLWSEWFLDGSVPSGFDLLTKACPRCGTAMKGEGQDIPFETFLGFKGDKVPDIDLNFSGEYQPQAHNYTKILFGERNVFRAGTIGTVAEKTAFGFVKKYEEDKNIKWRSAEEERLAIGCTGVKRSTGQHPGGIVVVPEYIDVEDITPVQYPADDTSSEWKTTHFDYHAFDANLLKLDILGHDDPTMMRMLQDLTGVDPTSIPMNDPKVMSIFSTTEAIGVTQAQIRTPVATYGVPEMGTRFVRQMLEETQPKSFADLLQISGLSHGTGVWLGNAQDLIKNGICSIKTVIGCRDDIMLFLIYKAGMDAALAFKITESVRKGKGLTDEWIQEMKNCGVPQWYIDSCLRIEYMFPKAHAAAYVISAVRTAYFKVYYPIYFYATYFTVRAEDIELELLTHGYAAILAKISEIESKGFQASTKERNSISSLEIALEMTARGFTFSSLDLARSDARKFLVEGNALIPPFSAVAGIGENAARNIAAARGDGPFLSIEDFQSRSRATKTVIELLTTMGCFRGLPDSNQLALF